MKSKLFDYFIGFKDVLKILLLVNIIFLLLYLLFLKSFVLKLIANKEDLADLNYYTEIFQNLDFAILFVNIIIILTLIYYERIKKIFINNFFSKNLLTFCVTSNIVIQLLLIIIVQTQPISDSKYYIENANLLYKSGSYINSYGNLTAFWPVGLPAYLAFLKYLVPDFILAAKIINIFISSGLIIICYYVFKDYLTSFSLNIFLILFTFFPNNLFSSNIILTDYPFTFLLWSTVLVIRKLEWNSSIILPILAGIFLGIASFFRPAGILLPIIFAIIIIYKKYPSSIRNGIVLITVFIMILLPWGIRNFKLFHSVITVSTNGGYIFLMGNHKGSSGGVNFGFDYDMSNPNEAAESRKAYLNGFKDIINNPIESLIRIPKKILQTYYRGDSSITWALKNVKNGISPIFVSFIFYITNMIFYMIILSNLIVIIFNKKDISYKKFTELIIVSMYIFFILIIFVGSERYHIPLLPIHIFLAAKYFELKKPHSDSGNMQLAIK